MKAYWKDMFDYETSQTISGVGQQAHLKFNMYFNADYARARGVEVILKSRIFTNWYADVNLNYSLVTGKSSSPNDNLLVQAGVISEKNLGESFMGWDRPIQFFSNLYYNHPSNWGASLRFEFGSTRRYTRSIPGTSDNPDGIIRVDGVDYYIGTYEGDRPYSYFADYNPKFFKLLGLTNISGYSSVDLKLHKTFHFGGLRYKIFIELENLFDEEIPRSINSFTGEGYNPGEIIPYSMISRPSPNYDPSRIGKPRTVQLGVQILF
jgi:outer membrane receptor protein involved in Fe transport